MKIKELILRAALPFPHGKIKDNQRVYFSGLAVILKDGGTECFGKEFDPGSGECRPDVCCAFVECQKIKSLGG